jgi:D-arabinose 1-dehydrogenase-like Zn-dependent alcohol dehydrogenase
MEGSLKSLAREGTLALVGGLGGYDATLPTYELISKGATARGVIAASRAEFVRMVAFMEQHDIHPVIDRVYDFADFQQAMRQLESGEFIGKLVLRL